MNNDFLNSAFIDEEKALIPTVTVTADENPEYETDPGNDTQDKIFLLSIDEANNYFNSDKARKGKTTDYADVPSDFTADYWWLRSPGENDEEVALVTDNGRIYNGGYHNGYEMGVRPALWIDLNS